MAKTIMEPAIERYLSASNITWDVSTHPSGLRTYFVPVGPETDWKAIVEGFKEPLVGDAPALAHFFWSLDPGGGKSWQCGSTPKNIRKGRVSNVENDIAAANLNISNENSGGSAGVRKRVRQSTPVDKQPQRRRIRNSEKAGGNGASSAADRSTKVRRRIKQ
jgi:hypothetical protein